MRSDSLNLKQLHLLILDCENGLEVDRKTVELRNPVVSGGVYITSPDGKYLVVSYNRWLWVYQPEKDFIQEVEMIWLRGTPSSIEFRGAQLHITEREIIATEFLVFELDCDDNFKLVRIRNYCFMKSRQSISFVLDHSPSQGRSIEISLNLWDEFVETTNFVSPPDLLWELTSEPTILSSIKAWAMKTLPNPVPPRTSGDILPRVMNAIAQSTTATIISFLERLPDPPESPRNIMQNLFVRKYPHLIEFATIPRLYLIEEELKVRKNNSTMRIPEDCCSRDRWRIYRDCGGVVIADSNPNIDEEYSEMAALFASCFTPK
ncbi:hypothetical protein AOL_s00091g39 [Orbilia oligospora ATCC 24927]|uniref:Uncharacterized protein n=1 Tax=Arthrobotrys oligospora (strain ATCC 24927 / CBS 115.81 / DSM 1491) TaxID=756982 RepID=G1XHY7_ARTOA|nr:hypothetical protein AOL_s00091g39 [Orbilia oligospora ATCC 24927]EGX47218.1 hypothetical protein AOL_s00091g39 [Orbilia oligospora ATCC 24927]